MVVIDVEAVHLPDLTRARQREDFHETAECGCPPALKDETRDSFLSGGLNELQQLINCWLRARPPVR